MIETDREKVRELAIGDEVLERYVEEAKMVEKNDNYLREAYDHEQSMKESAKEEGYEEGKEQGKEEMIETMYQNGMKEEEIAKVTNISIKRIKEILEK